METEIVQAEEEPNISGLSVGLMDVNYIIVATRVAIPSPFSLSSFKFNTSYFVFYLDMQSLPLAKAHSVKSI